MRFLKYVLAFALCASASAFAADSGAVTEGNQTFVGKKVFTQDALNARGTLTGDITLSITDSLYESANGGASDRNVALPTANVPLGLTFIFANVGTTNSLVFKSGATTIVTATHGQVAVVSFASATQTWAGFTYTGASSTGFLTLDGTTTGATTQSQVFTNGVTADALTGNTATTLAIASKTAAAAAGNPITITASAGNGNTNGGGAITLTTGAGVTSGAGGTFTVTGGAGGTTGAGANVAVNAGNGGTTSGAAGTLIATAGAGGVGSTTTGGVAKLVGGASGTGATGNGGKAQVVGGAALSTAGNGANAELTGGLGTTTGAGGIAAVAGGVGGSTGSGGNATVTGGASAGAGGTAGNAVVDAGAATGGAAGVVQLGLTNATGVEIKTLLDSNGNPLLATVATASAVDGLTLTNAAAAGHIVNLAATGTDSNISFTLGAKGTGSVQLPMGGSTSFAGAETIVSAQTSIAGVGNGADNTDDTLFTVNLPANSLKNVGDYVVIEGWGKSAANTHNCTAKLFFGSTTAVTSGTISTSSAWPIHLKCTVIKTGASTQFVCQDQNLFGSTTVQNAQLVPAASAGETDTSAITIKMTGSNATSQASEVLGHAFIVRCGHQ